MHATLDLSMYIGVDIGGTKTLISQFSEDGELLEKVRFETPKDYEDFIAEFKKTFEAIPLESAPKRGAIGCPGKIDRDKGVGIAYGNLSWQNVSLGPDISKITGCPMLLDNDANLAGVSEAKLLEKTFKKVLYVTVSTGIGGGLIVEGKIEPNLSDMEIGHMLFERQGKLERWEHFASGKAIVAKYGKPASELDDPNIWYVISRDIALGLFNVITALNPEVIVIGGGVGTHFSKYEDQLTSNLQEFSNHLVAVPEVRGAQRAEEAVLYGCYEVARQNDQ